MYSVMYLNLSYLICILYICFSTCIYSVCY